MSFLSRVTHYSLALFIFLPSISAQATDSATVHFTYEQRTQLPAILFFPSTGGTSIRASSVIDGISQLLHEHTGFKAVFIDLEQSDECQKDPQVFTCLTQHILDQRRRTEHLGQQNAPIALVISIKGGEEPSVKMAAFPIARPEKTSGADELVRKNIVFGRELSWVNLDKDAHANEEIVRDLKETIERVMNAPDILRPRRSLLLNVPEAKGRVILGLNTYEIPSTAKHVRFIDIPSNEISLEAHFDDFVPFARTIPLGPDQETAVNVEWKSTVPRKAYRTALFWTGITASAAGLGMLGYAVSRPDINFDCIGRDPRCPEGFSNRNFYPIGAGLTSMGLAWTLGPILETGDYNMPWWSIVTGMVSMALVSGTIRLVMN